MTEEEKATIKAKKIECWLGIFFLIPPILGVFAFVLCLLGDNGHFAELYYLSSKWTARIDYSYDGGGGGGMSAAPIYLALMALVGAYLIKGGLKYLFIKTEDKTKDTSTSEPINNEERLYRG